MMFTRTGYEIWYEPASTIYHKESQSTGQDSPLRTYYMTRNRLLLVKRNWHGLTKYLSYIYIIGIVCTRDILKNMIKGKKNHIKTIYQALCDFVNSKFNEYEV